jgi:hypothetical protein
MTIEWERGRYTASIGQLKCYARHGFVPYGPLPHSAFDLLQRRPLRRAKRSGEKRKFWRYLVGLTATFPHEKDFVNR